MMDKEEFRKNQPVAYRILSHALKSGSLSHAYMLSGPTGAPLKQTALLLAQSVFCPHPDEDGFACQNCLQCHQIAEQNHPDFFRLAQDGRTSYRPLKKKEIQEYWKSGGNVSLPETRPENYVIRKEQIQQLQDFSPSAHRVKRRSRFMSWKILTGQLPQPQIRFLNFLRSRLWA